MSDITELSEVRGFDSYPARLGDVMRGERATLGKSLLDVQRDLRIKATYISAIENCDPSAFQTSGFIAGYVRSYARYLSLDPDTVFKQFCVESGFDGVHADVVKKQKQSKATKGVVTTNKKAEPIFTTRTPFIAAGEGMVGQFSVSGLGSILVLVVLILGLGYGAWVVLQDIQRVEFSPITQSTGMAPVSPDVSSSTGVSSNDPGSDLSQAGNIATLDTLYRPTELEVPVMTPRDGPIASLDPDRIGALVENNGGINARETAAKIAENTPKVTEDETLAIAIVATRPAWVRVSRADKTIVFERILDGGDSFQVPTGLGTTQLRAGNSGSVYLTVDGAAFGPLGPDTSVIKNVALAPDEISNRFTKVVDQASLEALSSPNEVTMKQATE